MQPRTLSIAYIFYFLFNNLFSQVPVYEEPLHKLVFSNQFVRILDIQAQPADTSQLHVHNENYCYVTLRGGSLWLEETSGTRQVDLPDLFVGGIFNDPPQPLIHRFANSSSHPIRLFTVERLGRKQNQDLPVPPKPGEEIVLDNPFFRAFRIKSLQSIEFIAELPSAIVSLNSSHLPDEISKQDWIWIDKGKKLTIPTSDKPIDLMCIQIK